VWLVFENSTARFEFGAIVLLCLAAVFWWWGCSEWFSMESLILAQDERWRRA
jgi:hypothetical protein